MLFALFPIGDDNSDRRTVPFVTYALIVANILVFLFLQGGLTGGNGSFTYGYSVVPYEITHNVDIPYAVRSQYGVYPNFPGPHPIFLTILTAMFMHGGWAHLLGNMLYLWIFGDNIEDALGHVKFFIFYLLCGVIATFAHIASGPDSLVPSLGASGAIAGVLGGYILLHPARKVRVLIGLFGLIEVPAVIVIGLWAAMQFMNGFGSIARSTEQGGGGVAYMAHVGGFVAGLVLVKLFANRRTEQKMQDRYQYPMERMYDRSYSSRNPFDGGPLG